SAARDSSRSPRSPRDARPCRARARAQSARPGSDRRADSGAAEGSARTAGCRRRSRRHSSRSIARPRAPPRARSRSARFQARWRSPWLYSSRFLSWSNAQITRPRQALPPCSATRGAFAAPRGGPRKREGPGRRCAPALRYRRSAAFRSVSGGRLGDRGRQRPEIRDDRVEVLVRDVLVELESHERQQLPSVAADALRDRALDLVVRPAADAELRMLRDVRREGVPRLAERLREQIPAGADSREVVLTFDERRVAIRAVAERMREIAAVRDLVVLVRLRHRADGRSPVR